MTQLKCTESIKLWLSEEGYSFLTQRCDLPAWHDGPCKASIEFPMLEHLALTKYVKVEFIHPPIAYSQVMSSTQHASCHPKEVGIFRINRYGCYPDIVLAQDLCFSCANEMIKILNGTP